MKNRLSSFFIYLPILYTSIAIVIAIYTFNKGLVMDDEGFYLYLLKDLPNGAAASQFHKLIHNIFKGDIFTLRISNYIFELVSILIYSLGLYSFLKSSLNLSKKYLLLFFCFTLIGFSLFSVPVCAIPYYVTLNRSLTLISLGLLLIGINNRFKYNQLCLLFSGFFIGLLFFIMLTNTPIYSIFILLIYFYSDNKLKNSLLFVLGIALSFLGYFTVIESIPSFFQNEILPNLTSTVNAKHNEQHGVLPMFRWVFMAITYLLLHGFLTAFIIFGYIRIIPRLSAKENTLLVFFLVLSGMCFYYSEVVKGEHSFASISPFLSLFIFFIIDQHTRNLHLKNFGVFFISLLFIPFFLSIGTNVDFKTRATEYVGFIFPLLFIISEKLYGKKFYSVLLLVIGFYLANITSMLYKKNWGGFIYTEQINNLKTIGIRQNIKTDDMVFDNLKLLKNKIFTNDTVLISSQRLWGYAYLLDVKPLSYKFKSDENEIITQIQKYSKLQNLTLLEIVYAPFTQSTIEKIKTEGHFKITDTLELGVFKVYKTERSKP